MNDEYLTGIIRQFQYYKLLAEKTFEQLDEEELFLQLHPESNSVAILVNHLWGNMKSRWTDFLDSDGEKDWRERDREFEDVIRTRKEMIRKWEDGWKCLFDALEGLNANDLDRLVYIRNQGHTVLEAINRQYAHYCYHIGQIVFLGKLIKGEAWKSLSIPKGGSGKYNQEKFAQDKQKQHFAVEYLKGMPKKKE